MGNTELGSRLKQAREQAGLTQAVACEQADIQKVQTLSAYERGVNSPPLETLKNLAALYKVSTDSIIFGNDRAHCWIDSPEENVRMLVTAVDKLKLTIIDKAQQESAFHCSLDCDYLISFDPAKYVGLGSFVEKWKRLRELLDSGIIDQEEYDTLIEKRLSTIKIEKIETETYSTIYGNLPFDPAPYLDDQERVE